MTTRRAFLAGLALAVVTPPLQAAPTPQAEPAGRRVGLELVLAVDGSASISDGALEFQLRGHAAAFRDRAVAEAAAAAGVAVTLCTFSGPGTLHTLVPWTIIDSVAAAEAFAAAVAAAPRDGHADSTALGSAIDHAAALFGTGGVRGARRVIDLVSNGFSNAGTAPAEARDRAAGTDITVNALAILDEFDWLEEYFQENVIGGPNAFVKVAEGRDSFAEALRQKLILEIAGLPGQPAPV